jgi:nifR3 family TIM-barrel protein
MSIYQNIPSEYHVGHIRIAPNIVLAPMVGVTDSIFRRMILSLGGCGLVSSEMTNAASVSPRARTRHNQLEFLPEERPITMQLSGNEPDLVSQAARTVEQLGADILDINCGCPSPKVTGGGHGSALLKDLCKMEALIKAVIAAVQIPVTLKYRAGWDDNSLNYLDTARMAEAAGIKALALHPRTRAQLYTGTADWSRVREVREVVSIPVVGSGDVKDAPEALHRLEVYNASGIMIGRGAMENPWIFMQVAQLRRGEPMFVPQPSDKCDFLVRYIELLREELGERLGLNKTKQLIGQFAVDLPYAAKLREHVHRSTTLDEARNLIEVFFAQHSDPTLTPA